MQPNNAGACVEAVSYWSTFQLGSSTVVHGAELITYPQDFFILLLIRLSSSLNMTSELESPTSPVEASDVLLSPSEAEPKPGLKGAPVRCE